MMLIYLPGLWENEDTVPSSVLTSNEARLVLPLKVQSGPHHSIPFMVAMVF